MVNSGYFNPQINKFKDEQRLFKDTSKNRFKGEQRLL